MYYYANLVQNPPNLFQVLFTLCVLFIGLFHCMLSSRTSILVCLSSSCQRISKSPLTDTSQSVFAS